MSGPQLDIDAIEADRLELIDTLASGDGQRWSDFWENAQQRQIAETMYGKQADEILASAWLAKRNREVRQLRQTLAAVQADAQAIEQDFINRRVGQRANERRGDFTPAELDDWLAAEQKRFTDTYPALAAAVEGNPE